MVVPVRPYHETIDLQYRSRFSIFCLMASIRAFIEGLLKKADVSIGGSRPQGVTSKRVIVLSAFRKFGDYLANSTEIVAHRLHEKIVGDFIVHSVLFDANITKENRGATLFSIAHALNANGIISLGMASEKTGLCIERIATNKIHNLKYCPLNLNDTAIDTQRPYEEKISLDLNPWNIEFFRKTCEEKDVPVMKDSEDAGGFCCNHLAYQARVAQLGSSMWGKIPFIFIHTPCSPESVSDIGEFHASGKITMPIEKIVQGVEILLSSATPL